MNWLPSSGGADVYDPIGVGRQGPVEKILAPHERLRVDWPVEGTTGYDYINLSLGLLVDASAEAALSETYRGFAGGFFSRLISTDQASVSPPSKPKLMMR